MFLETIKISGIVINGSQLGKGDLFVVEADESDGTFLNLNPVILKAFCLCF